MNIHPIFVHFPIALLTLYSLIEFVRYKRITIRRYWFHLKVFLVTVGGLGALLALGTGKIAADQIPRGSSARKIVDVHSGWAAASTAIYGIIAICYLITWLKEEGLLQKISQSLVVGIPARLTGFAEKFVRSPLIIIFALAGLVAITVTGALGASMVYGPDVDPVVKFVYSLIF